MPDISAIRSDFPILARQVYGRPLVYLDNAATSQLPQAVLDALCRHYAQDNANIHRGIHALSEASTRAYEAARETVRRFLGAAAAEEIIFTSGATASVNLAALALTPLVGEGDEIVVTQLEHHSNFVPWQMLCARTGAVLKVVPARDGDVTAGDVAACFTPRTRLAAVTQVSNLTGAVLPLREIIAAAHARDIPVLVDGAQGVRSTQTDMQALGCDFYCFSGHKTLAPTGTGALYMSAVWQKRLAPVFFGGGMVDRVRADKTTFAPAPHCWEAGTPNYAGAIALAAALDYIEEKGRGELERRERALLAYTVDKLSAVEGLRILGTPARRAGVVSFTLEGVHPYDLASVLDKFGIAVRSGSHCAQPALASFGLEASTRVSPAFYNTQEEIDCLAACIVRARDFLTRGRGVK